MEIWKKYFDYDIEISNFGNIRKFSTKRKLTPSVDRDGYFWYMLRTPGKKDIKKFIHTLVLELFVGERPSKTSVGRHLDGNKQNNSVENLIWGSHIENIYDRLDVNDNKIFFDRQTIINIKNDLLNGLRQRDIINKYHISRGVIHLIATEKSWKNIGPSLSGLKTDTRNRFTDEEKEEFKIDFENGMSISALVKKYGRTDCSIRRLIKRLNLKR